MNITIAIEELVIEGIPLSPSERPLLARAVQRELTRLYTRDGVEHIDAGQSRGHLAAQDVAYTSPVSANALGYQIARAVYGALQR
jgi:hypothetical protein